MNTEIHISEVLGSRAPKEDSLYRKGSSRKPSVVIWFITAFAFTLRLLRAGGRSFSADESFTYQLAQMDWHGFLHQISNYELNMAPYYALMRAWVHLGMSEFILRLPSAIFATLTVPVIYFLCRRLFGVRAALLAALLLSVNTGHIAYAQEARSYSLAVLLCSGSALFLLRAIGFSREPIKESNTSLNWAGFVILSVLAVYTHFFCLFVLMAFGLALAVYPKRIALFRQGPIAALTIGILIAPAVWFSLARGAGRLEWVPPLSFSAFSKVPLLLAGSAAALALYLLFWGKSLSNGLRFASERETRWSYWFVVSWLVLPVAITVFLSLRSSVLVDRFLIICLPAAVLLAADGLSRLSRAQNTLLALVVLVSIGADVRLYRRRSLQDCRTTANYVFQNASCGDTVIFIPEYGKVPFEYYRDRSGSTRCKGDPFDFRGPSETVNPQGQHVWIVAMGPKQWPPQMTAQVEAINHQLAKSFQPLSERKFEGFHVMELDRTQPVPAGVKVENAGTLGIGVNSD